jgi:RNase P/RNase MRP subunit POP5
MEARKRRTAGERRKQLKEKEENAKLLLVFGDFLVTAIWVCLSSTFGEVGPSRAALQMAHMQLTTASGVIYCASIISSN